MYCLVGLYYNRRGDDYENMVRKQKKQRQLLPEQNKKGVANMCDVLRELMKDDLEDARKKGEAIGKAEGDAAVRYEKE